MAGPWRGRGGPWQAVGAVRRAVATGVVGGPWAVGGPCRGSLAGNGGPGPGVVAGRGLAVETCSKKKEDNPKEEGSPRTEEAFDRSDGPRCCCVACPMTAVVAGLMSVDVSGEASG